VLVGVQQEDTAREKSYNASLEEGVYKNAIGVASTKRGINAEEPGFGAVFNSKYAI
jgi:hypothetical protein